MHQSTDVIVIGGGLAGLAAAAFLARAGRRAVVLEKASAPGGRAATQEKQGFSLNLGPHALYRGGAGKRVLAELGVAVKGRPPSASGAFAFDGGALHALPGGPVSLLTTGLLPLSGKLEVGRLLARLGAIDTAALDRTPASAWIDQAARSPEARRLLAALFRVSNYAADLDRLSAGAGLAQLRMAVRDNVLYLDGGWRTIVDGLRDAATAAGATIVTGARATAVEVAGGEVTGVVLASGERLAARTVIVAASPEAASALAPGDAGLARAAAGAVPVKAACLDLGLSALPRRRGLLALGLDRALYLSVHSATAALAPEGGAMIHVAEYLAPGREGDASELEALLDRVQPGWREVVVERRFLPSLTVSHALVTASGGGLAGRPACDVAEARGLLVAGDWVGAEGMLADASLASAKRAAELAGARSARCRAA